MRCYVQYDYLQLKTLFKAKKRKKKVLISISNTANYAKGDGNFLQFLVSWNLFIPF